MLSPSTLLLLIPGSLMVLDCDFMLLLVLLSCRCKLQRSLDTAGLRHWRKRDAARPQGTHSDGPTSNLPSIGPAEDGWAVANQGGEDSAAIGKTLALFVTHSSFCSSTTSAAPWPTRASSRARPALLSRLPGAPSGRSRCRLARGTAIVDDTPLAFCLVSLRCLSSMVFGP